MRIGTWNVEFAQEARLHILRKVMSANRADVWVLTETHDDLVPEGTKLVAHSEQRPGKYPIRPNSRWVSIYSKFPVVKCVLHLADPRRTVAALLDLGGGKQLLVYGTVMPWHSDRGDAASPQKPANWSEHNRIVPQQCAEWAVLQRHCPNASLCVAGDFNTDLGTGSYYGTKAGIASLVGGFAECDLFCATAPGRVPSGMLAALPIDHIAVPVAWARSASVVAAWPAFKGVISDHSGLIVEVDADS